MEIGNAGGAFAPSRHARRRSGHHAVVTVSGRPGRNQSQESNMKSRPRTALLATALALAVAAIAPASIGLAVAQETAVAPEKNPPGDIPDNQVFVQYTSPLGFGIKIPEGWSRAERPDGARFSDKYNIIDLAIAKADQPPTAASAATRQAAELKTAGRAVDIKSVKDVKLRSGPAVLISYVSNSDPNPVTNKQIRLEHERFLMFKNGTLVSLDLSAPLGADNVDQWKLMSNSFQWQ
jgi:hypothetical protein